MKCSICRKAESEINTWWDNVRLFLFDRIKQIFNQDFEDLIQDKFTQGISDGYKLGFEACNKQLDSKKEELKNEVILDLQCNLDPKLRNRILSGLFCSPNPDNVLYLDSKSGKFYFDGKLATDMEMESLRNEAKFINNTRLWSVLQNSVVEQARKTMCEKSTSFEDMKTGKAFLWVKDFHQQILNLLEKKQ